MFHHHNGLGAAALNRKAPSARCIFTGSSVSAASSYTFTAAQVDVPMGANINTTFGAAEHLRARFDSMIVVCVHGEDSATLFSVSSVTIGAVAGTEQVDRGGATSAINTAIYTWAAQALADIANTDVVVTWSENITACSIAILVLDNMVQTAQIAADVAVGTGALELLPTLAIEPIWPWFVTVIASTCATGGGTEVASLNELSTFANQPLGTNYFPMQMYADSSANIDFAGAVAFSPSVPALNDQFGFKVSWSGAGAGDAVAVAMR